MSTDSETDEAFSRFCALLSRKELLAHDSPQLKTEADTRAKLIDPIFRDVLGWGESEIRRESPLDSGYSDYVFGAATAHLLVEAKRTRPRFCIQAVSRPRKLKLGGPHLLGNRKMKPVLEQARRYASELGAQVAVATNGGQFVIFRPYLSGRHWTTGIALVFHGHDDISQEFALFHKLLARDNVVSGIILDSFEEFEGITETLTPPIKYVYNGEGVRVRNPFWPNLSRIIGPILTDQPEDPAAQERVIQNCYVTTKLSDQADSTLNELLKDIPSSALADAGFAHTEPARSGAFAHSLERDIEKYRPGTYILTGGVGSGKTTFLRRFALVVDRAFIDEFCVWCHVDFLTIGNVESEKMDDEIRKFIFRELRSQIEREYQDKAPRDGAGIRELFSDELEEVRQTRLFGLDEASAEYAKELGGVVDGLFRSDQSYVRAVLRRVVKSGVRVVLVLDNTDQQGEEFQQRVFLLAQRLSDEYKALCVVALREERFFAAFRRGVFDAFGDRKFHVGSPDIAQVLRRRLDFGKATFRKLGEGDAGHLSAGDLEQVEMLLDIFVRSTTQKNANIVRMLSCISSGDMRLALGMFRDFVSSGNTDVKKILGIAKKSGGYTVPFHEFAKSAILGNSRYFQSKRSHIVNVFKKSAAPRSSHLTAIRLIARLNRAVGAASPHGEGFVATSRLLQEYRASFGQAHDFEQVASDLMRRGLLESEPPKIEVLEASIALRITAAGAYYWSYLIRAFAYVDLVWIDTPISDRSLAKELARMADSTDMDVRFDRCRKFLAYLSTCEKSELTEVASRSGPYREALMPDLVEQVEAEMDLITTKKQTGAAGATLSRPTDL